MDFRIRAHCLYQWIVTCYLLLYLPNFWLLCISLIKINSYFALGDFYTVRLYVLHFFQLDGNVKELFPIGSTRTEPEMLPLMDDKILVLKDEVQV